MIDKFIMDKNIKKLQMNLLSIRKIAGWTAEGLGDRIGVTKQTISNLETGKTKLTQTQYIAIRAVLDYEMQINKDNTVLAQVIDILLNNSDDDLDEEKERNIRSAIETVAATAAGGVRGVQLMKVSAVILLPLAKPINFVGEVIAEATLSWLNPFMKKNKKNKK